MPSAVSEFLNEYFTQSVLENIQAILIVADFKGRILDIKANGSILPKLHATLVHRYISELFVKDSQTKWKELFQASLHTESYKEIVKVKLSDPTVIDALTTICSDVINAKSSKTPAATQWVRLKLIKTWNNIDPMPTSPLNTPETIMLPFNSPSQHGDDLLSSPTKSIPSPISSGNRSKLSSSPTSGLTDPNEESASSKCLMNSAVAVFLLESIETPASRTATATLTKDNVSASSATVGQAESSYLPTKSSLASSQMKTNYANSSKLMPTTSSSKFPSSLNERHMEQMKKLAAARLESFISEGIAKDPLQHMREELSTGVGAAATHPDTQSTVMNKSLFLHSSVSQASNAPPYTHLSPQSISSVSSGFQLSSDNKHESSTCVVSGKRSVSGKQQQQHLASAHDQFFHNNAIMPTLTEESCVKDIGNAMSPHIFGNTFWRVLDALYGSSINVTFKNDTSNGTRWLYIPLLPPDPGGQAAVSSSSAAATTTTTKSSGPTLLGDSVWNRIRECIVSVTDVPPLSSLSSSSSKSPSERLRTRMLYHQVHSIDPCGASFHPGFQQLVDLRNKSKCAFFCWEDRILPKDRSIWEDHVKALLLDSDAASSKSDWKNKPPGPTYQCSSPYRVSLFSTSSSSSSGKRSSHFHDAGAAAAAAVNESLTSSTTNAYDGFYYVVTCTVKLPLTDSVVNSLKPATKIYFSDPPACLLHYHNILIPCDEEPDLLCHVSEGYNRALHSLVQSGSLCSSSAAPSPGNFLRHHLSPMSCDTQALKKKIEPIQKSSPRLGEEGGLFKLEHRSDEQHTMPQQPLQIISSVRQGLPDGTCRKICNLYHDFAHEAHKPPSHGKEELVKSVHNLLKDKLGAAKVRQTAAIMYKGKQQQHHLHAESDKTVSSNSLISVRSPEEGPGMSPQHQHQKTLKSSLELKPQQQQQQQSHHDSMMMMSSSQGSTSSGKHTDSLSSSRFFLSGSPLAASTAVATSSNSISSSSRITNFATSSSSGGKNLYSLLQNDNVASPTTIELKKDAHWTPAASNPSSHQHHNTFSTTNIPDSSSLLLTTTSSSSSSSNNKYTPIEQLLTQQLNQGRSLESSIVVSVPRSDMSDFESLFHSVTNKSLYSTSSYMTDPHGNKLVTNTLVTGLDDRALKTPLQCMTTVSQPSGSGNNPLLSSESRKRPNSDSGSSQPGSVTSAKRTFSLNCDSPNKDCDSVLAHLLTKPLSDCSTEVPSSLQHRPQFANLSAAPVSSTTGVVVGGGHKNTTSILSPTQSVAAMRQYLRDEASFYEQIEQQQRKVALADSQKEINYGRLMSVKSLDGKHPPPSQSLLPSAISKRMLPSSDILSTALSTPSMSHSTHGQSILIRQLSSEKERLLQRQKRQTFQQSTQLAGGLLGVSITTDNAGGAGGFSNPSGGGGELGGSNCLFSSPTGGGGGGGSGKELTAAAAAASRKTSGGFGDPSNCSSTESSSRDDPLGNLTKRLRETAPNVSVVPPPRDEFAPLSLSHRQHSSSGLLTITTNANHHQQQRPPSLDALSNLDDFDIDSILEEMDLPDQLPQQQVPPQQPHHLHHHYHRSSAVATSSSSSAAALFSPANLPMASSSSHISPMMDVSINRPPNITVGAAYAPRSSSSAAAAAVNGVMPEMHLSSVSEMPTRSVLLPSANGRPSTLMVVHSSPHPQHSLENTSPLIPPNSSITANSLLVKQELRHLVVQRSHQHMPPSAVSSSRHPMISSTENGSLTALPAANSSSVSTSSFLYSQNSSNSSSYHHPTAAPLVGSNAGGGGGGGMRMVLHQATSVSQSSQQQQQQQQRIVKALPTDNKSTPSILAQRLLMSSQPTGGGGPNLTSWSRSQPFPAEIRPASSGAASIGNRSSSNSSIQGGGGGPAFSLATSTPGIASQQSYFPQHQHHHPPAHFSGAGSSRMHSAAIVSHKQQQQLPTSKLSSSHSSAARGGGGGGPVSRSGLNSFSSDYRVMPQLAGDRRVTAANALPPKQQFSSGMSKSQSNDSLESLPDDISSFVLEYLNSPSDEPSKSAAAYHHKMDLSQSNNNNNPSGRSAAVSLDSVTHFSTSSSSHHHQQQQQQQASLLFTSGGGRLRGESTDYVKTDSNYSSSTVSSHPGMMMMTTHSDVYPTNVASSGCVGEIDSTVSGNTAGSSLLEDLLNY